MLPAKKNKPVVPFIPDQRIWLLELDEDARTTTKKRECLRPEAFAVARELRKGNSELFATQQMPKGCQWTEVPDRQDFLMDLSHKRLCLTIDAGIGKTTAVQELQYLRACSLDGHLVIGRVFDELPKEASEYLSGDWLVKQLLAQMPKMLKTEAKQLLMSRIRQGRCSLLVDAMDQVSDREGANLRASALATFLNTTCPDLLCVVTGRPYAIENHWERLFATSNGWEFAQIDQFTPDQCRLFLGDDARADKLEDLEVDLVSIPRMLETVYTLSSDELDDIKTPSDLYWRSVNRTLDLDWTSQNLGINKPQAMFYFSLLAFELLSQDKFDGIKSNDDEIGDLLFDISERRKLALKRYGGAEGFEAFSKKVSELGKLNSLIDHSFQEDEPLRQIVYRDRTLLDFFAAIWITKYLGQPELQQEISKVGLVDLKCLRERQFVRANRDSREFEQFWRFATEMPNIKDASYAASMSVLFETKKQLVDLEESRNSASDKSRNTKRLRSTAMIYRCFYRMLKLANYEMPEVINDKTMRPLIQLAQRDATKKCEESAATKPEDQSDKLKIENIIAKNAILNFLSEYPRILRGEYGVDARERALEFESWFVDVPEKPNASLVYSYRLGGLGDGEVAHGSIDAAFLMSKYQTTRGLYGLFEVIENEPSKEMHPIAGIDFYDAWCSAVFFHSFLPTEDEWEYANRGRPGKVADPYLYCYEDPEDELANYAWFGDFERGVQPVGELRSHAGLYDMHGNVLEWSLNWYFSERAVSNEFKELSGSRVLRGGSFNFNAMSCRSSYRSSRQPSFAVQVSGVRFARARKS